jgi:3-deoxy-manno-octulosonate cytidylyltransferase (CMP-KDO synthetase)
VNHTGANPQTKAVAIIPARFASTRLPGKPLLEIAGKPMICRVVERVLLARSVSQVIVATDDARVLEVVRAAGHNAVMTKSEHASGTDRLAEVARSLADAEIIVNVQGDEPLISAETIDRAVAALRADDECSVATTWEPLESAADVLSPDVVKVVIDDAGRAVYFSRSPIPYPREAARRHGSIENALRDEPDLLSTFRKHTGLYVYRRDFLLEFAGWPQSALERAEALEQLRALEHGAIIKVIEASTPSIGVDTVADLERVRAILEAGSASSRDFTSMRPSAEGVLLQNRER